MPGGLGPRQVAVRAEIPAAAGWQPLQCLALLARVADTPPHTHLYAHTLLQGLAFMHHQGYFHRDMKPGEDAAVGELVEQHRQRVERGGSWSSGTGKRTMPPAHNHQCYRCCHTVWLCMLTMAHDDDGRASPPQRTCWCTTRPSKSPTLGLRARSALGHLTQARGWCWLWVWVWYNGGELGVGV